MSEPAPLPPLPRPFATEPRPLRAREGCGRGALIGCGALIVLFGVGAVALSLRATEITVWMLQKLEERVAGSLAPEVSEAERAALSAAFADLYTAVEENRVDQRALQDLQRQLMQLAGEVERGFTPEQVRALTAAVRGAAGGAAASSPGDPAATPATPPS